MKDSIQAYQTVMFLYSGLKKEEDEIEQKRKNLSVAVSTAYEVLFFSFEIITGHIKSIIDEMDISTFWKVIIFFLIAIIGIPILQFITNKGYICFKLIKRKISLYNNIPDKELYNMFYYNILPLCSAIQIISDNYSTNLNDGQKHQMKQIVTDVNASLKPFYLLINMSVKDSVSENMKKGRVRKQDLNYCKSIIDNFKI